MSLGLTEKNINEYGRFDKLISTVDRKRAKKYFEDKEKSPLPMRLLPIKIDTTIRRFILSDGEEF